MEHVAHRGSRHSWVWGCAVLSWVVLLASGCAVVKPAIDLASPESSAGAWEGVGDVEVSDADVRKRLGESAVIFVGERHADPSSISLQVRVLSLLHETASELVIAVEWLPVAAGEALARYIGGETDEASLEAEARWQQGWGHSFQAYLPVIRWAREHGVAIHGVNAPEGLARRLGRVGVAGLSDDERAALTPLTTGNEAHRGYFSERMAEVAHAHGGGHHGGGGAAWAAGSPMMERFYLAQLLRDEHMAREAARLRADGAVVVVLAGLGHVEHGLGVPARVQEITGETFLLIEPWLHGVPGCGSAEATYPERRCDLRGR